MTDDSAPDLQGLKILVIDDSKTIRRTAETLLAKEGCTVYTATDGFDAAIVYDDLDCVEQLPIGYLDHQDGGRYRLVRSGAAWFDYVVGPHSLKNFIFPPSAS